MERCILVSFLYKEALNSSLQNGLPSARGGSRGLSCQTSALSRPKKSMITTTLLSSRELRANRSATKRSGYMQWGRDHEDVAICNFLDVAPKTLGDIYFAESPFFKHSDPTLGASPDGTYAIYGEDGAIVEEGVCEVKCPAAKKAPLRSFQVLLRASDVLGVRLLWAQECHCHLLGAKKHESLALVLVRFILENSLQYRHWFPKPCSL